MYMASIVWPMATVSTGACACGGSWFLTEATCVLISVSAFYVRRIRRIVPAYYVQLALLFLLLAPAYYGFGEWRYDTRFVAVNLIAHLSFLHYSTPYTAASLSVNGPLWSLAVEAQYYLVLPFLALLFVRAPPRSR